ncbi:hypothetical protein RO3G_10964 [Rhizopus delemar RA 99-880]|uniref:HTH CENPB-type domain-containing protein n=1 Tax=Rhizopus delemar (strain RA 99-880 / ATCC MYA-4621 / FGSC 9543 / NRRL 43880) TaxID=246409 RepID=I1CCS3_RHIO9|nr:hypothetical protein RO3G_10964 [Rhizopus delemar RA 99-880]|eukprot:EIE86253.1 hypothetical protein RO3G_10964 [Rhizopus delemar RA 99-880]
MSQYPQHRGLKADAAELPLLTLLSTQQLLLCSKAFSHLHKAATVGWYRFDNCIVYKKKRSNNKHVRLSFSKIELLDQNTTGQLNQTELGEWAMKKFNLDQPLTQQTISNILKNAETLYSNINVVNNGKSLKTTRYPQLDDEIVKFVTDMNNNNLPVNRDSILRYVRHIAQVKYRIPEKEISFSSGWLTKLFKRIGVKCRPMHGESASVDITSENIQNELRKIEGLLEPYDPVDIMNFDETGLYYQQPPRRTICYESLVGLKKTYVKKLDVAFGRQNRKIALLLDNASVHKIRIPLNNIKLIFLPANTTSKLQALDAGIIANFKAHFRAQQYDRALCLYISKKLDNLDVHKMDQAQAMFSLANAWLKVKPETIKNCWKHTKILAFKERTICDFEPVEYPTSALPLEEEIIAELNGMLPGFLRNFDNKVTDVSQLSLGTDESKMIVCYTTSTINNEETAEGNVDETEENDNTEQDEQRFDIVECKRRLREAYETILMYEASLNDLDCKLHRRIRMRLAGSCAELNKSKEQTV